MHTLGIDIGGTKIYAALYDGDWNVVKEAQVPTQAEKGSDVVYTNIVQLIRSFPLEYIQGIGLAWPGFVTKEGVIQKTPNISGFEGRSLTQELQELFEVTCVIENDARMFTLAENSQEPQVQGTLGIIFGTGCGGCVVLDGQVQTGAHGYGGEIGHIIIQEEQDAEDLFAGPGMQNFFRQQGWEGDAREIQNLMKQDKSSYKEAMKPLLEVFALWLRNLVIAYDPDDIVFGGSVGKYFWSLWRDEIDELVQQKLEGYPNTYTLRISQLDNAGALGAGMLVRSL